MHTHTHIYTHINTHRERESSKMYVMQFYIKVHNHKSKSASQEKGETERVVNGIGGGGEKKGALGIRKKGMRMRTPIMH